MSSELTTSHHCGVLATSGEDVDASQFEAGWWRLRHRGDYSWGLITVDDDGWKSDNIQNSNEIPHPVDEITNRDSEARLRLGHNRYITSEGGISENTQPFFLSEGGYSLGFAHNGNIPKECLDHLRLLLKSKVPEGASDSRIVAELLLEQRAKHETWEATFLKVLPHLQGAFSLACITESNELFAIRDPWGIRPLCIGKKEKTWVVASESVAIEKMGASFQREVLPGELVCFRPDGSATTIQYAKAEQEAFCLLEIIYFAKIESRIKDEIFLDLHQALGRAVGERFKNKGIEIDHVIPILNSGKQMSVGVSQVLGMPNIEAISLSTEQRSFIQNDPLSRSEVVHRKHVIDGVFINSKRILLCDDSLVRGTSLIALVANIKLHNPKEIHIVLGSEPLIDICDLGVDLPDPEHLLVYQLLKSRPDFEDQTTYLNWLSEVEVRVAAYLGVNSVTYLDRSGVNQAIGRQEDELCRHCFGGKHPIQDHQRPTYIVPTSS